MLYKIQNWVEKNDFKFLKTKTVCVHFRTKRKSHNDPCLHLDENQIKVVKEVKFLGVIFDKEISFVLHFKMLKEICTKALDVIKVVANSKWGADKITLLIFITLLSDPSWITVVLYVDRLERRI